MLFLTIFQIVNPVLPKPIGAGDGATTVGKIISAVVGIMLVVGFVLALFHLVFGAVAWISACGDKNRLQAAQERITAAIIGLIIAVAIWALMLLVGEFIGLDFPKLTLPTFLSP